MSQRPSDPSGLARCGALTPAQQSNLRAKLRLEREQVTAGLELSKRALAEFHGVAPSTYRGWMHLDALDRCPPPEAFDRVARYAAHRVLWREFGALG